MKKNKIIKTLIILKKSQPQLSMLGNIGKSRNSFQILISTILSARARDAVTLPLSDKLFKKYTNAKSLAKAKQKDVEKILKPIGFYRNKSKNVIAASQIIQKNYKGQVPKTKTELLALPGVGTKVAGCVLVYAFGEPAIPVDTHVHRVSNRLGWVCTKTPEKTEKELEKIIPKKYWIDVNEVLVIHGQTTCLPRTPRCSKCLAAKYCKKKGVKKND